MISIVVSVYNEQEMLQAFHEEIFRVLGLNNIEAEVIYVNDGSSDMSAEILTMLQKTQPGAAKVLSFSRNFGHEAAMIAGIDYAQGDAIVCLDSDLQHPPLLIPAMLEQFEKGIDIVNMVRETREDNGWLKNKLSKRFYKLINKLSGQKLAENASDFFLISNKVAQVLRNDYRERNRFLRGFIQIVGFRKTTLPFVAPKREAGVSKYPFWKLLVFSVNAVVSFSKFPLYLGIYIGLIFVAFSVFMAIYTLCVYLFGEAPPSGYTTMVLFMSVGFSIMFVLIGIIGVYVGYNFDESKKRPIYIVDKFIH
jgi:polyisoprenyl-phosphate glycosyltransferase